MPANAVELPPPKAAVGAANAVRRRIVTGRVPVGGSLPPEGQLLDELGVSRPTLRAALRILESEGLITVRRGSRGGAWVNAPTAEVLSRRAGIYLQYHHVSLDEIYRAQAFIEPPAVQIVATRAGRADVRRLEHLLEQEREVMDDRSAFGSAALRFHRALVELSADKMLVLYASMVHGVIEAHTARRAMPDVDQAPSASERCGGQERLIELISAAKAAEAAAHWAAHLEAIRPALREEDGTGPLLDLLS